MLANILMKQFQKELTLLLLDFVLDFLINTKLYPLKWWVICFLQDLRILLTCIKTCQLMLKSPHNEKKSVFFIFNNASCFSKDPSYPRIRILCCKSLLQNLWSLLHHEKKFVANRYFHLGMFSIHQSCRVAHRENEFCSMLTLMVF